jgi:spore germination protein YaaH
MFMLAPVARVSLVFASLLLVLSPLSARAGAPQGEPASWLHEIDALKPHKAWWEANKYRPMPTRTSPHAPGPVRTAEQPERTVYGFLPYWEMGYQGFQWDLLTHVAYFSAEMKVDGTVVDANQWYHPSVQALIADAHANGVYVTLTATLFDNDAIGELVSTPAYRATAIETLLQMVLDRGADGVNIDFEFVPAWAKADFVTFMEELTQAFHAAIPHSHVSYAGPSVDWSGAYDYDLLAAACDAVFVMAYGYHWGGGPPGPTAPLTSGDIWSKYNVTWTVADYVKFGGPLIRSRLILGLPVYGRDWATTGPEIPGTKTANGTSVVYTTAKVEGAEYGWNWDSHSQCPYYLYKDGAQWHQVWVDRADSLGLKYAFAVEEELAGIGFWALGYDGGDGAFWSAVAEHYPPAPPAGGEGGESEEPGEESDGGSADAGQGEGGGSEPDASSGEGDLDAGSGESQDVSEGPGDGGDVDAGSTGSEDSGTTDIDAATGSDAGGEDGGSLGGEDSGAASEDGGDTDASSEGGGAVGGADAANPSEGGSGEGGSDEGGSDEGGSGEGNSDEGFTAGESASAGGPEPQGKSPSGCRTTSTGGWLAGCLAALWIWLCRRRVGAIGSCEP